jgi:hypothetical protein
MRKAQFVLSTAVLMCLAGLSPARAESDYPWCIQDAEFGYPGDCSYRTREECLLSVSGRQGYCGQNPAEILRPQIQPPPRNRHVPPY